MNNNTYTSYCYILLLVFQTIVHFSFVLSQITLTLTKLSFKKYQHAQVQINSILKRIVTGPIRTVTVDGKFGP
jgi:hypothetical protein